MLINNDEYFSILEDIKKQIKTTQYKAVLGANKQLMELYWNIGKIIISNTKYGSKFIDNLSRDIALEFPNIKGFSTRNLKYMRKFAEVYPDFQKVQQSVALLPWRNNITLMTKINDDKMRDWYIFQNLKEGWNNVMLLNHIELKLYEQQAISDKTTNNDWYFNIV